ncbi:PD-(D/E)XK nuclease-like domain-containing protein [Quisquiliibacterium transsilvanicum]|uniref:Exodeoxyribonuclease VIII n=1 Tax=Quisquiliibacterium transsilvanicum TaxID=1549638 RepID=A0A7W8M817_9BURK|nr:PD-(D/E)XK nuclease-like domain-containing protein [Quisquiliibacterium transsilvanicum]MBB5271363.1 exodeoxyribonuclease VIII [Quisquiliibacterium transsilvanicum]
MNALAEPVIAPGLHRDMPAEQYHAIQAMSAGGLKRMRKSPAHFYGMQLDPSRPASGDPTPAMKNGTLVHCCIFEPDAVKGRYVVRPDGLSFSTKDGKAWRDAQSLEIIDGDQLASARAQAAALRALPDLEPLLADGYGEASAFWIDEATGELCKCRPDWVSPAGDGVILVDGKTCQDASPDGFGRAIWNMDYWLQAAWYSDGFEAATGLRVHGFVFGAVESTWPHAAAAYMLSDDVLDAARRENRRLLNLYAECKRTGVWPGYAPGISLIQLPAWAQRQLETA